MNEEITFQKINLNEMLSEELTNHMPKGSLTLLLLAHIIFDFSLNLDFYNR